MTPTTQKLPIVMSLAKDREDKGQTENYRVYGGGGHVVVKNKRGENVSKNTILGGNGTIYIANELAGTHDEWVLLPRVMYDQLVSTSTPSGVPAKKAGKR